MYTPLHLLISLFFLSSYFFVASLGILSGSPLNLSIPFTSLPSSLFCLFLSLPLPPPLPRAFFWPSCFLKVFAQCGLPNEAAPVVDRARRCGLSPCRAINWCRLWCAAVHERCSYVPPMLPVRTMFIEAADHQLHYSMCLGIISNTSYLSRSSHPRY